MKKFLLCFILTVFLLVFFMSISSCINGNNSNAIDDSTSKTADEITDDTTWLVVDTLPPEYVAYNYYDKDSFIAYWKKQQGPEADNKSAIWRALDGSPETSLLFPKVSKDGYWYDSASAVDTLPSKEDVFISYCYNYVWGGDDWTEGTMIIKVYKGNTYLEMFQKDELTYDDLKYFVNTFWWDEYAESKYGEIEYVDDMIIMRNEYRVFTYFIYSGRIISVEAMDADIIASPERLLDYLSFEEINLD